MIVLRRTLELWMNFNCELFVEITPSLNFRQLFHVQTEFKLHLFVDTLFQLSLDQWVSYHKISSQLQGQVLLVDFTSH